MRRLSWAGLSKGGNGGNTTDWRVSEGRSVVQSMRRVRVRDGTRERGGEGYVVRCGRQCTVRLKQVKHVRHEEMRRYVVIADGE